MKLYQVPISPFVRIARATAHVKRLTDRIELVNRNGGDSLVKSA